MIGEGGGVTGYSCYNEQRVSLQIIRIRAQFTWCAEMFGRIRKVSAKSGEIVAHLKCYIKRAQYCTC